MSRQELLDALIMAYDAFNAILVVLATVAGEKFLKMSRRERKRLFLRELELRGLAPGFGDKVERTIRRAIRGDT